MKGTQHHGVFEDRDFLWTKNKVPGVAVYGEKLRERGKDEFRNWNPFRSKMGALLRTGPQLGSPGPNDDILYLGASSGTTVSHLSDVTDGLIYAVEFSPRSARDLVWNMEPRNNVVPIIDDAGRPERYAAYISKPVDVLIQDVAQRHQVDIFLRNMPFLKPGGKGYLFVKARSIQVAGSTKEVYDMVRKKLLDAGVKIVGEATLEPFEKDHHAFVVMA